MAPAVLVAQGASVVDLDGPLLLAEDRQPPLTYDEAGVHPPSAVLWGMSAKWEELSREVLSDDWALLTKSTVRFTFADGSVQDQMRQVYDRGDGAVILPYDPVRRTVLLGRQFRWPAAYRGDSEPFLIEAAAGLLEAKDPGLRIREEAQEELGLTLTNPDFLFSVYMSPGSVSEQLHFFAATYGAESDRAEVGGLRAEGEEIQVIELALNEALAMIKEGGIRDAKTIILLQHAALTLMPEI